MSIIKFEKFVSREARSVKAELDRIVSETQAELETAVEFTRSAPTIRQSYRRRLQALREKRFGRK
jgi:hypothetical protein